MPQEDGSAPSNTGDLAHIHASFLLSYALLMSTPAPQSLPPESDALRLHPELPPQSAAKRPWEWVWQMQRAQALRIERERISPHAQASMDRAQAYFDAAERLSPTQAPDADVSSIGPLVELLKQAACCASLAILDQTGSSEARGKTHLTESGWREVSHGIGLVNSEELWATWLSRPGSVPSEKQTSRADVTQLTTATLQLLHASKRLSIELDSIISRRIYAVGIPLIFALAAAVSLLSAEI